MIRAYIVYEKDSRSEQADIVFDESRSKAKWHGYRHGVGDYDCNFLDMRVELFPAAEPFNPGIVWVVNDPAIYRAVGFRGEDADECSCCGLSDFEDGRNPLSAVCPECDHCGECGHEDECTHDEEIELDNGHGNGV